MPCGRPTRPTGTRSGSVGKVIGRQGRIARALRTIVRSARAIRPCLPITLPTDPDLVPVGRVGRPHGIDGSFFVEGPSDRPGRFADGATLYVGGEPAKVVVSKRGSGRRPVIKLDRPVERGTTLAVPREALPPLEEDCL